MGGQRNNAAVVSDERKQTMKANYQANKATYNKNKIIKELQLNKRLHIKEETIAKYEWSETQLAILKKYNDMFKKERTVPRPIINLPAPSVYPPPRTTTEEVQPPDPTIITDRVYTRDMAVTFLKNRINRKTDKPFAPGTISGHISKINPLLKLFGVESSDLIEIYGKLSEKEITDTIVANPRWKTINTLRSWAGFGGLLSQDRIFAAIIGPDRVRELQAVYRKFRDDSTIAAQQKRDTDDINYREIYHNMFDKVEQYTKGTQEHAIAMLYTYGMYSNVDENKLVIVPRNYFHSVLIVHNEAEMT